MSGLPDMVLRISARKELYFAANLYKISDMTKFQTAAHLASWSGQKPRNDVSNGKYKSRRITHGNVFLRKTIIECAWGASRTKDCYSIVTVLPLCIGRFLINSSAYEVIPVCTDHPIPWFLQFYFNLKFCQLLISDEEGIIVGVCILPSFSATLLLFTLVIT